MKREWKAGDLGICAGEVVAYTDERKWLWTLTGGLAHRQGRVDEEVRPLVVIDPEDREQVERLAKVMWEHRANLLTSLEEVVADALREFADPKPRKPEEPTGLGAVVKDAGGRRWVRFESKTGWWWRDAAGVTRRYVDIEAVEVLSPGVQP